jgi:hypothetical protein
MYKSLSLLLLLQFSFVSVACSPEGRALLSQDLNALGLTQPATATATGWQPEHQQPGQEAFVMAAGGQVNEQQINSLFWLTWPQSHDAMVALLGRPSYRSDVADYYKMPNGHWLVILYQAGNAIGFSLGDSGAFQ